MSKMILFSALLVILGGQLKGAEPQPAELGLSQLPPEIHRRIMTYIVRDEHPKRALSNINGLYCTDRFWCDQVSGQLESMIKEVYDAPRAVALLYGGIKKNRAEFLKCAQKQDAKEYDQSVHEALKWYDGSAVMKKICTELLTARFDCKQELPSQLSVVDQKVLGYHIATVDHYNHRWNELRLTDSDEPIISGNPILGLIASTKGTYLALLYRKKEPYQDRWYDFWHASTWSSGMHDAPVGYVHIPEPIGLNFVRCSFDHEEKPLIYYMFHNQANERFIGVTSTMVERLEDLPAWKVADYRIVTPEQQQLVELRD